jgi:predicted Zn-dependent protease
MPDLPTVARRVLVLLCFAALAAAAPTPATAAATDPAAAAGTTPAPASTPAPAAPSGPTLSKADKAEVEQGQKMHAEIVQSMGIYNNPELQEYVGMVGRKIAQQSNRPNLPYTFTVVDAEEVNAFATMGGFVYISRGILPYLSSEAELAAVLGHEIGHITAKHMARQKTQGTVAGLAGIATAILTGQPALAGLTNIAGEAMIRGYGRDMELEADRLGAEYLARTGYDPDAMIRVIRTLKDQERFEVASARQEGRQPHIYHGLFSTHPDNDTRLKEAVQAAQVVAGHATGKAENEVDFLRRLDGVAWGTSAEQGVVRGSRMYHAGMGFTVAFPTGWNVENGQERILATSKGKDSVMMVQTAPIPPKLPEPRAFVLQGLMGGRALRDGQDLEINGLPAYTAVTSGAQTPFGVKPARLVVVKYANLYFVFMGASRSAGAVPDGDRLFLSSAETFRRLRGEELGRAEPDRIRVIEAPEGATMAALAADSPLTRYPVEQLRLFNRLYPRGEPTPGQLVKVVR